MNKEQIQAIESFFDLVEKSFETWMVKNFSSLINLPYLPYPVMVYHINRFLSSKVRNGEKTALVVMDGMALDQWLVVCDELRKNEEMIINENRLFAWVPTITPVSRQVIFSGLLPKFFEDSIHTTSKEEKLWRVFWENEKLQKKQVGYFSALKLNEQISDTIESIRNCKVAGFVINAIDDIAHGTELGTGGLHQNVSLWMKTSGYVDFVNKLIEKGFTVYITSDHGNVNSKGIGNPGEGALAETKGERVRVFSSEKLLEMAIAKTEGICWKNVGLPSDYFALLAEGRKAFINKDKWTIAHGGICIEEVIVPFVEIRRKHC